MISCNHAISIQLFAITSRYTITYESSLVWYTCTVFLIYKCVAYLYHYQYSSGTWTPKQRLWLYSKGKNVFFDLEPYLAALTRTWNLCYEVFPIWTNTIVKMNHFLWVFFKNHSLCSCQKLFHNVVKRYLDIWIFMRHANLRIVVFWTLKKI